MISKSSFVKYTKCNKYLWLHLFKKDEEEPLDAIDKTAIEDGNLVGELARSYFDNTKNVSKVDENGVPIYSEQIKLTKEALNKNANCIAEASFMYEDLFCAVDLLKKDNEGYSIYEVKNSLKPKESHFVDVSFQKYVLEKNGLKINHIYILHPNKEYVLNKKLNLQEYFVADCVDDNKTVLDNLKNIEKTISNIRELLKAEEPKTKFSSKCKKCTFEKYCLKELPEDNVSVLNGLHYYDYINKGIITIEDYAKSSEYEDSKNSMRKLQLESILNKTKSPIIDKEKLKKFIDDIKYPIYHLDFETTSLIIPQIEGFRPGEVYPFQYSLHIEHEDGIVEHKEFLGEELDPTRALAEQLVNDIPEGAQLMAYKASTEMGVIKNLADKYPDLSKRLLNMHDNFVDLLEVFKNGYYYNPKQGGSNSIKFVMPAVCPHMEEAYHNLPIVHNGGEAKSEYLKLIELKDKDINEYNRIREGMLKYCELDTLSMVEILKVLRNALK